MSQIQDAIRKAKEDRDAVLGGHAPKRTTSDVGRRSDDVAGTVHPRATKLEPKNHWVLDPKVLQKNRIIHDDYSDDALNAYKMLRTRVRQQMSVNKWQTLAVTAADEGAGKTLTAVNLAIMIALHGGHSVYLLDFDLRRPGISRCFGMPTEEVGLGEYLSGKVTLPDIIWDVGIERLSVVPGNRRFQNSSEMLTSPQMQEMISTIVGLPNDPIVIIDLPPVLSADDALAIAPMVDAILFVVTEAKTKRSDMLHSLELLKDTNLVGVALNQCRTAQQGY